ncbi:hypothetical protein AB0933_12460 [Streptomyces venezuelae]|uniref:hypothetical protein n=1 Tax=Streptomyces venezuelae TaxID=54571 RepID=UPI003455D124
MKLIKQGRLKDDATSINCDTPVTVGRIYADPVRQKLATAMPSFGCPFYVQPTAFSALVLPDVGGGQEPVLKELAHGARSAPSSRARIGPGSRFRDPGPCGLAS